MLIPHFSFFAPYLPRLLLSALSRPHRAAVGPDAPLGWPRLGKWFERR